MAVPFFLRGKQYGSKKKYTVVDRLLVAGCLIFVSLALPVHAQNSEAELFQKLYREIINSTPEGVRFNSDSGNPYANRVQLQSGKTVEQGFPDTKLSPGGGCTAFEG